jgi:hypothetical protein
LNLLDTKGNAPGLSGITAGTNSITGIANESNELSEFIGSGYPNFNDENREKLM